MCDDQTLIATLLADLAAAFKKSDPSAAHADAEPYPSRMSPLEPGAPDDGDGIRDVVQGIEAGAAQDLLASVRQQVNDHQAEEARRQGSPVANRTSQPDPIELLSTLYQQVGTTASGEGLSSTGVYAELVKDGCTHAFHDSRLFCMTAFLLETSLTSRAHQHFFQVDLAMGMGQPQLLYTFLAAVASHEVV